MDKRAIQDSRVVEFVNKLNKSINVERIILFGSRAKGEALAESDYDFIIVSRDFKGVFFTQRSSWMYDFWESDLTLEALCYTPEEFEEKANQISIVNEAIKTGVEIKAA